ncbi:DinB family protein [Nocardioides pantholopis]|uniref:DinB family protein n=1 Tax=Nocardioides pantholopis TaxID=2483798 RepID=UPI000F078551|nr:DinB family protein [Nocardioides pantholopis]
MTTDTGRPTAPPAIAPDTKDWTWVLERPCPECGYRAVAVDRGRIGAALRADADGWLPVLARPDAGRRPAATTWSPLEYACHVRDAHVLFGERVVRMLTEDDPHFDNWDQDEAALRGGYARQDPAVVGRQLVEAAAAVAVLYDAVPEESWQRPGRRSNGSRFTIETLARYHLHDAVHHTHDVG